MRGNLADCSGSPGPAVDYFCGKDAFAQQQERDARKKKLCRKNGCALLYVLEGYVADEVLGAITAALTPRDPS
ncbi:MAG: hypothetical protein M5U23_13085 [Acidimicrobiia bacterium]|nr:hypothetical protein [Acidimicrobiia bacterium]